MQKGKLYILGVLCFALGTAYGQTTKEFKWPKGAKAAFALTYDDGLPSHVNTVAPMLKKYNFKATFYPAINSPSLYDDIAQWKNLAIAGHELGNHTVYHPCQKSKAGMEWVEDHYNLDTYTVKQLTQELELANTALKALDGKEARTFAYPCAHYLAGGESYKSFVVSEFLAARGSSETQTALLPVAKIDLHDVPSWAPNGHSAEELIAYIQKVIDHKTFGSFTFHGIGAAHMVVATSAHEKMLQFLDANRDAIWVASFQEITAYIKSERAKTEK